MLTLLRSRSMKLSHDERKFELLVAVTLLLLLPYCKCQKEVCGTKTSEAVDVMWMIHTNNDIQSSDFLILKQFLSDMMLWFRISFSETDTTRHGYVLYSDTVQEVSQYEITVEQAQKNFISLKRQNTTGSWLDEALYYLEEYTVDSDRDPVPNVAVFVTAGQPKPAANTSTAAIELTNDGWNIIFIVVTSKVDNDQMQNVSSEPHLNDQTHYSVCSFTDLKSLDFQQQFARAICGYDDYIEENAVRLRRDSENELGYVNVAEKKPAKQSYTYQLSASFSSLAVDGDLDKCSKTTVNNDKNWWEVDLEEKYDIEYVSILNTVAKNLTGTLKQFDIFGHNGYYGGSSKNSQLCGSTDKTPLGISELFKCLEILDQKRYIRIQQIKVFAYNDMAFCEVQAFTAWPLGYFNAAVDKTATQSSTNGGAAKLAVDGSTELLFSDGSCSRTKGEGKERQWWQLDLNEVHDIFGVTVFNRREDYQKLINFDVSGFKEMRKSKRLEFQVCGSVTDEIFFTLKHFPCEMPQKRYILIDQTLVFEENFLTLCEVEVWTECEVGYYGRYCKETCEDCKSGCDKATGECNEGTSDTEEQTASSGGSSAAGPVVGVLLVILVVAAAVGGLFYYKKRKNQQQEQQTEEDGNEATEQPPISFKWLWEKDRDESARKKKASETSA